MFAYLAQARFAAGEKNLGLAAEAVRRGLAPGPETKRTVSLLYGSIVCDAKSNDQAKKMTPLALFHMLLGKW